MRTLIIITNCILIIFFIFPCSNSFSAEKYSHLVEKKTSYTYPIKIEIKYWGNLVYGMGGKYSRNVFKEEMNQQRNYILKDKQTLMGLKATYSKDQILKNYEGFRGGYYEYLMRPDGGNEGYENWKLDDPLDCGYIIIDKDGFIWPFLKKGPAEWLLYNDISLINRFGSVSRHFSLPTYDQNGQVVPEKPLGQYDLAAGQEFEAKDPYFAHGVIGYLKDRDFEITVVQENVDFNPKDFKE
ncbi:MAG: hypothetical protein IPP74_12520 [Alphaproteobacteria bacterium]|nr:hypothetical protein [Alphaproteobacteria bacterium]